MGFDTVAIGRGEDKRGLAGELGAPHGRLTVVGFDGTPLQLPLAKLVMGARSVTGHLTGSPTDTENAMRFAVTTGVRPRVQTVPPEEAQRALDTQQHGRARFRMVLTTGA